MKSLSGPQGQGTGNGVAFISDRTRSMRRGRLHSDRSLPPKFVKTRIGPGIKGSSKMGSRVKTLSNGHGGREKGRKAQLLSRYGT
ncbi:hypothetical protein GJ744_007685 [Endocarpon pusillum]|uniref:Uncharacterized protein n=1 Tax=Endocarpon pusillum TaxID=364733 RepID=A0A8H7AMJ9_9EURO|nr:hypothetical protein GJ744_007685 [Endocarpon pusillum]